jgi:hypothetical protein
VRSVVFKRIFFLNKTNGWDGREFVLFYFLSATFPPPPVVPLKMAGAPFKKNISFTRALSAAAIAFVFHQVPDCHSKWPSTLFTADVPIR